MQASSAALYGKGVFTTVAIVAGNALFWERHWKRLTSNAAQIGIDLSEHSDGSVSNTLRSEISKNNIANGKARITFFDERPTEIWPAENSGIQNTSLQILVGERRMAPEPFNLSVSPFPINSRSPLAGVKSCNYLEQILAIEEAKARGFHEAVRTNERGHITSGCMSNIFWLKNDRLYTPALTTGCLPGTTREFVLENIDCEEVEAGIGELDQADAIFLTSAGLGIIQAAAYGSRQFKTSDHPILDLWPGQ